MIDWNAITWTDFEQTLAAYHEKFHSGTYRREEEAYVDMFRAVDGLPIRERAEHVPIIVTFLNAWHCRFSRAAAEGALPAWIEQHADDLQELASLSIENGGILEQLEEIEDMHDSLIDLKRNEPAARIHNMSDACASKMLHAMIPQLFVMWDLTIKASVPGYSDFMERMHAFACRLRNELAPAGVRSDLEGHLQNLFGFPIRKTLAKHIDEYNWYVAFGQYR